MTDAAPLSPALAALIERAERCYKRSRRAAKRLAAAELELSDANEAGKAACAAVLAYREANPEPQMEMAV